MQNVDAVLQNMKGRAEAWEQAGDRRFIFLRCYGMMSANMAVAIREGRFADPDWVAMLMLRFADYYFEALGQYDQKPELAPAVWRQVHEAAQKSDLHVMQNLLLGVNAHINFDLPLALYDCLHAQWPALDDAQKRRKQDDHELVNQIIGDTIDAVQDEVVEPQSPLLAIVDRALGRMDEWLLSQLITSWRHDVWQVALHLVEAPGAAERARIRQAQEQRVMERAESLIAAY